MLPYIIIKVSTRSDTINWALGYSAFCLLQGPGLFFGVQNFEFHYLFGIEVLSTIFYGYANFSRYSWGMPFSTGIFFFFWWGARTGGGQFKNLILWCFFYTKYSNRLVDA